MEERYLRHSGPMHTWFNLSYASYLVLPRTWIQEMPTEWQQRLKDCLEEMKATLDVEEQDYRVNCIGENGKFVAHKWNNYRRGPFPALRRTPSVSGLSQTGPGGA